jgi:hypothetical protein
MPSPVRPLRDGLYHVTNKYFSASFIIEGGKVTKCAPILRRNIKYWMTKAERICDAAASPQP